MGAAYTWDQENRLTSYTPSAGGATSYSYRADGMRVSKSATATSTSFAYDGQMGFEDTEVGGSNPGVTDYAIGARGLDRLAFTANGTTTVAYPLYDGHGNMVGTLAESGASYTIGNGRQFDAWGKTLYGNGQGDPKGRYCASVGHKQDDESGLTYMRARYYDSSGGRFCSTDPGRNGANWFVYCGNQPTDMIDPSGKMGLYETIGGLLILLGEWLTSDGGIDLIDSLAETPGLSWLYDLDAGLDGAGGGLGELVIGIGIAVAIIGAIIDFAEILEHAQSDMHAGMSWDETMTSTLSEIDQDKSTGNFSLVVGASMAEEEMYLLDIDADD